MTTAEDLLKEIKSKTKTHEEILTEVAHRHRTFDIDKAIAEAIKRIKERINRSAAQHLRAMREGRNGH